MYYMITLSKTTGLHFVNYNLQSTSSNDLSLILFDFYLCPLYLQLTIGDLHMIAVWDALEIYPFLKFKELLAAYPTLVAHRKRITELPRIKEHFAKRPQNTPF